MDKIKNEEIVFREVNDLILNCNEREIRAKIDQSPELQEYLTSNELWDGESIHFWKCNWSPLHTAARYGRESVVRTLVEEFRIKVDAKQSYRTWSGTALHAAIYWNRPWIVKILIGYGADTSLNGRHWNGKVFKDAQHYSEILGDRNEIIRILQNINKGAFHFLTG